MRIRTVKPEFWNHPVMVRQTDAAKLLAIGLLNYADDDGYFYAEPAMVRAALRPLDDDSTTTRRCLGDLSRIGYLSVCDHPTHGPIGKIVSFRYHQKIDRPKESKIKMLYDSTIPRRFLDDESLLEQGTGNREQGRERGEPAAPSATPTQASEAENAPTAPGRAATPPLEAVSPSQEAVGGSMSPDDVARAGNGLPAPTPPHPKPPKTPRSAAKPHPPGHADFVLGWCAAYLAHFGEPYKHNGGRDGKAVNEMLALCGWEELLAMAKRMFTSSGYWCQKTNTVHGMSFHFNEIRMELNGRPSANGGSAHSDARPRWKVLKDLEDEETHLANNLHEFWEREQNPGGVARLAEVRAEIAKLKGEANVA